MSGGGVAHSFLVRARSLSLPARAHAYACLSVGVGDSVGICLIVSSCRCIIHVYVCAGVRACVRSCVRACVRMRKAREKEPSNLRGGNTAHVHRDQDNVPSAMHQRVAAFVVFEVQLPYSHS